MTRRERLEARAERRREWAAKRRTVANATLDHIRDHYTGDIAFNTQPGHIPLRARVIAQEDRAFESLRVADHHDAKADGLEHALDRTVFSDDENAIQALESRIAEHEAKRDRMKEVNRLWKKQDTAGLASLGIDLDTLNAKLKEAGAYWGSKPHLPYELTNLGARIRSDRERIEQIKARTQRTERAESGGGVLVESPPEWHGWCRVTFAEKPERETLDALRAAGFRWGGGCWSGELEKLPAGIQQAE